MGIKKKERIKFNFLITVYLLYSRIVTHIMYAYMIYQVNILNFLAGHRFLYVCSRTTRVNFEQIFHYVLKISFLTKYHAPFTFCPFLCVKHIDKCGTKRGKKEKTLPNQIWTLHSTTRNLMRSRGW